jgi:hypothetical protein
MAESVYHSLRFECRQNSYLMARVFGGIVRGWEVERTAVERVGEPGLSDVLKHR